MEFRQIRNPIVFVVLYTAVFLCSSVQGMTFLGEPAADMPKGRWSIGVSYSSSNMDLEAGGEARMTWIILTGNREVIDIYKHQFAITGLSIYNKYGTVGYGLTDNISLSFSLGETCTKWQNSASTKPFVGFGAKITFFEKKRLKFGAIANFSWLRAEFEKVSVYPDDLALAQVTSQGKLSLFEFTSVIGPSYQVNNRFSIYGGPFITIRQGDFILKESSDYIYRLVYAADRSIRGCEASYDLDQTAVWGGLIGAKIKISDDSFFNIEYKHASASYGLYLNINLRL
ncbi:MAG: hypothetical protein JW806_05685 [Sedimentisphaerales bacterium]|nr:hypothetical protein [Sedimentisphaerales bacterium]